MDTNKPNLGTPRQALDRYPWLTESSLRYKLAHVEELGLERVVIRQSPRRLLLDFDEFDAWLDSRRVANLAGSAA